MSNKQILIVEDSATDLEAIKNILSEIGDFTISVAEDGEDGVRQALSLLPDLILMDIVLPQMNGFQATRKITQSEEASHIPIIVVTTKEQVSDNIWAIRQGASGFVNKPVSRANLEPLVAEALA